LERLKAVQADLLCVVAYGQILPKALLDAPKLLPVNVHASLLPKYRGAAPIEWAVAAGETETGVCVQKMAERLDAGDVLAVSTLAIGPDESAASLHPKLAALGAELLSRTVADLAAGKAPSLKAQDEAQASYAPLLKKSDGAADFSLGARSLYDRYRAFKARPGFYVSLDGETLKVSKASLGGEVKADAALLKQVSSRGFEVACADGQSFWLEEVQPQGGKAMPAADYARGHGIEAGKRLAVPVFQAA
jgi:methionyl-tRNA formyltransferase